MLKLFCLKDFYVCSPLQKSESQKTESRHIAQATKNSVIPNSKTIHNYHACNFFMIVTVVCINHLIWPTKLKSKSKSVTVCVKHLMKRNLKLNQTPTAFFHIRIAIVQSNLAKWLQSGLRRGNLVIAQCYYNTIPNDISGNIFTRLVIRKEHTLKLSKFCAMW